MSADEGREDVVGKPLPRSLSNALQQYARELARKMRAASARNAAKEQVASRRGPKRRGRSGGAPGLMDIVLARRCAAK